jgi:predicted AlkP superfamily phosphohydrolase/phosphomutase/Flp pilus assembly protein TadD
VRRLTIVSLTLVAVALVATAAYVWSRPPRIIVLGLDGLDPRAVDALMAEGKLPNFSRLRRDGAYSPLLSSKPLLSPVVWTTIATGKPPEQHGIGHFVAVEPSGAALPVTSQMRKVKALWNIFSGREKSVATVGWWATWPAEVVRGVVVSDHTCYHFLFPEQDKGARTASGLTFPAELADEIAGLVRRPSDITTDEAAPYINVPADELRKPFDFSDEVSHFRWALATAESYRRIGLELWKSKRPDLLMVYIEGTDSVSHLFGHLYRRTGLAGELAEQQKRYGNAVERIYVLADAIVGDYMNALDSRTTLVVLSDHGFELGATQDDPSKTRDMRRVSERFHRPEGILYLYGRGVKSGVQLERPTTLDVAPTVLALSGLPAALDMPGRVLTEALTGARPPDRIATFENGPAPKAAAQDTKADPAILEHLKSLGYVDGKARQEALPPTNAASEARSPSGDRNIAALHFEAGRYQEAAAIYARLLQQAPEDPALLASFAGALGALHRYAEARKHLEHAIRLQPLNVEAQHNLAVILEREGKRDEAIERYRTALRYDARYEPARRALMRLTGNADVTNVHSEAERQAMAKAEEARALSQRGDYPAAMARLDEAERLAPRLAIIQQYRANVAYLMGDVPGAIRALRRGLALEPDNALFRENILRLQKKPAPSPVR